MKTIFRNALGLFILLSLLTGLAYPLAMTGLLQMIFPIQANGSLLLKDGQPLGSALLAQKFTSAKYFWPRPSAADYATMPSGASNLGPTSAALQKTAQERRAALQKSHGLAPTALVPEDLVFASASGLDPHISPEAAYFQLARVSAARQFTPAQRKQCRALIRRFIELPQGTFLGDPRVNVLLLNLELDKLQ